MALVNILSNHQEGHILKSDLEVNHLFSARLPSNLESNGPVRPSSSVRSAYRAYATSVMVASFLSKDLDRFLLE